MKYEYLIFNIIVISGPLFFGSLKKFYFLNHLRNAFISILLTAIPFIIWDIIVTERHWFFADKFTLDLRIFGLPIEEILFFITVPYACLFTWQMLKKFGNNNSVIQKKENAKILIFSVTVIALAIINFLDGKEYTGLAFFFFGISILFDRYIGSQIITKKIFIYYFLLVSIFTLIFNGYLTWRPIVTYDIAYQLDFRIFTVPIEDFFFGYALLIFSTSIFEKLVRTKSLRGVNDEAIF